MTPPPLPPCRHRGEARGDRWVCKSEKLVTRDGTVSGETCLFACPYVDHLAGPARLRCSALPPKEPEPTPISPRARRTDSPRLSRSLNHITAGVTSAPREPRTLYHSLSSLRQTGFKTIRLFADCEMDVTERERSLCKSVIVRKPRLGAWQNFVQSLRDMLQFDPTADGILMVQDDTLFCSGVAAFLERVAFPADLGVALLGTPRPYQAFGTGLARLPRSEAHFLRAAWVLLFPRNAAQQLIEHPLATTWQGWFNRRIEKREDRKGIDTFVGRVMNDLGLSCYAFVPSLAAHIGHSTLGHGAPTGRRSAASFPGVSADATSVHPHVPLTKPAPQSRSIPSLRPLDSLNKLPQKTIPSASHRSKRIHIAVTTYNRPEMLHQLLEQIDRMRGDHAIRVDIFDDGSSQPLKFAHKFPFANVYRRTGNGGVAGYWSVVDSAFRRIKETKADYYYFLQDDYRLVEDFFNRSIALYEAVDDPHFVALNLCLDQSREGKACWTDFRPQRKQFGHHQVWLTQWTDICFLTRREFYENLDFQIRPISSKRWENNPHLSTGVGQQISQRLAERGKHLYQVADSLVHHGNHPSRLFPKLREQVPLIARPKEPLIAGMATIPSRVNQLPRMLGSLLPQIDHLHVYLNGFPSIPSCLQDSRITCYLDWKHRGNLGDAGKFFLAEKQRGYYFSVDDDLLYPPDYVATLVQKIEEYGRQLVVGVHGIRLTSSFHSYLTDRVVEHFQSGLKTDKAVHLLGTGTLAYHTETMSLSLGDFPKPNMADIWFGLKAQRQRIGMLAVSRPAQWLKQLPVPQTLYAQLRQEDARQTQVIQSQEGWTCWASDVLAARRTLEPPVSHPTVTSQHSCNPPNPYGTHLPFLKFLVQTFRPQRILELGTGEFSTPVLLESGAEVISLETDRSWWERTQTNHPRHTSLLWPDENVQNYLDQNPNRNFDLAFVDGPTDSRVPCVQALFGRAEFIVIHDSFTPCYRWNRLNAPANYRRFDYKTLIPATSVFVRDQKGLDVITAFCEFQSLSPKS